MTSNRDSIAVLVEDIWGRNETFSALRGKESKQKRLPPATDADIVRIEEQFDVTLPDDYRTFLKLHAGWAHFLGDYSLLSPQDIIGHGPLAKRIALIRDLLRESSQADHPIIILAGPYGKRATYFEGPNGSKRTMDVVEWDPGGEILRHRSFTDYLKSYRERLDDMIRMERQRHR